MGFQLFSDAAIYFTLETNELIAFHSMRQVVGRLSGANQGDRRTPVWLPEAVVSGECSLAMEVLGR